jgi:AraC-like DNA-binding protein
MSIPTPQSILLNEHNWTDVNANMGQFPFRISELFYIERELNLKKCSFKYNLQGSEMYTNGKKDIVLQSGEYLLALNHSTCEVKIDQKDNLDFGLCIDMNLHYLQEGLSRIFQPNELQHSISLNTQFFDDLFFNKFQSNLLFQDYLQQLFLKIKHQENINLLEIECDFVHTFLRQHKEFIKSYFNISVIKPSTKKDLYDKMITAKNYLHESIYTNITIPEIAAAIYISPYRFFHIFKDTFQISPHQYLLKLKMQEAINLHRQGKYNWTEIAELLHFSDVQSFSKRFKKMYGISPMKS